MPRGVPDTKIVIDLPDDGTYGPYNQENVHAASLGDGLYEVLNVPTLANGVHLHDVVRCRAEDGAMPRYERVVEPSGWGTLHLIAGPTMPPEAKSPPCSPAPPRTCRLDH